MSSLRKTTKILTVEAHSSEYKDRDPKPWTLYAKTSLCIAGVELVSLLMAASTTRTRLLTTRSATTVVEIRTLRSSCQIRMTLPSHVHLEANIV